ncbi:MAG: hypothetical protein JJT94_01445 [Bernardetiaceae bacterium]|nr:hypothetical protein [Bernardetiaceae bacterium]
MRIFQIALCLILTIGLNSCIDIKEELVLQKDGSGSYRFVLDASQSAPMIQMILQEGANAQQDNEEAVRSMVRNSYRAIEELAYDAEQVKGVKKAIAIRDTANYTFGISFDFDNIDVLNTALYLMFDESERTGQNQQPAFAYDKKGNLERLHANHIIKMTQELSFEGNEAIDNNTSRDSEIDVFLKNAVYSFAFQTEGKIKNTSHKAFVEKNKNSVAFSIPILEVQKKMDYLTHKIKFK